jgi:hypothetical protein
VIVVASELYAEVKISFHHYGRFLDLKTMQFRGGKPDPEGTLIEGLKSLLLLKGYQISMEYQGTTVPNECPSQA